jgi:hypothetical protein
VKKGVARKHADENGHDIVYSDRWDAWHCLQCAKWLEKQCSDEACSFCVGRPETP